LVEQGLGLFRVGGVEAFGELAVNVGEHRTHLVATALTFEQSREAGRRRPLQALEKALPFWMIRSTDAELLRVALS
jgi:hypothetical protein